MTRTLNGNLIGAAAAAERRDYLDSLLDTPRNPHAESDAVCQEIADLLGSAEAYSAWWETTPNDNEGFLKAAREKLAQLETLKHSITDYTVALEYDQPAPTEAAESDEIQEWPANNFDGIAEVEF